VRCARRVRRSPLLEQTLLSIVLSALRTVERTVDGKFFISFATFCIFLMVSMVPGFRFSRPVLGYRAIVS